MSMPELRSAGTSEILLEEGDAPVSKKIEGRSPLRLAYERLRVDRAAKIAFGTIVVIVLLAILAPVFAKIVGHGPNQQFIDTGENANGGPGATERHVLARHGQQRTRSVHQDPLRRPGLPRRRRARHRDRVVLGAVLGLAAGYIGGFVDTVIARIIDVMLSIPFLILAISIAYVLGPSLWLVIAVIGVLSFTYPARIVRGQVISIKGREYIEAARALGAGPWRIMFIDLLPNVMAQIIVYATLLIPLAIVAEASLSFLGVGVPPPTADWGSMINDATGWYQYGYWWFLLFPCVALLITTLAFNIFGDSVRDALDPRGAGIYV